MSVDHLDVLHNQLPELFQDRELSPTWDDDLIIIPIEDPEFVGGDDEDDLPTKADTPQPSFDLPLQTPEVAADYRDDQLYLDFERVGAQIPAGMDGVPTFPSSILDVLGGGHAGSPIRQTDPAAMPPPDSLAFYLPFHCHHPTWWGVYILFEGAQWLADEIVRRSWGTVPKFRASQLARMFLYYHEAFHHKTECFATRLELTHRKPLFTTGFERYYQETKGTAECLEEGLANASALEDTQRRGRDGAVDQALSGYVQDCPPGYNRGVEIGREFYPTRSKFAEDCQHVCFPHYSKKDADIWRSAPHMFDGISNIKSRVNYIIHRDSQLLARTPFRPLLPPAKLVKKLREAAGLEFVRHGGNHDVYKTQSGKTVPIPRHPRDLSRGLLRGILREAGLSMSLDQFLQL